MAFQLHPSRITTIFITFTRLKASRLFQKHFRNDTFVALESANLSCAPNSPTLQIRT